MQRNSTPHLIEARKQIVKAGKLGKVGPVDICCYFHMRANGNPPVRRRPTISIMRCGPAPLPCVPIDGLPRTLAATFMEYGNGIMGDMCVHMFDTARWMLDLGWPKQHFVGWRNPRRKGGKSNITDTQTATFEYNDFERSLAAPHLGRPARPGYPWALLHLWRKRHPQGQHDARRTSFPMDPNDKPLHFECLYEREQYPEDVTEPDIELNAAPATRLHMKDFPGRHRRPAANPWPTSSKATFQPPPAFWPTTP